MAHEDSDIRKAATGLEFIMNGPKLALDKKSYISLDLEKLDVSVSRNA